MMILLLGLRASEVVERTVRDVDIGPHGVWLWIDSGKTSNAERRFVVHPPLDGWLRKRTKGRKGEEWLFASTASTFGHKRREWLIDVLRRYCEMAGVPRVSPHGLRGTYATLSAEMGQSALAISKNMGHGSHKVTEDHYIKPGALEGARSKRILNLVSGGSKNG